MLYNWGGERAPSFSYVECALMVEAGTAHEQFMLYLCICSLEITRELDVSVRSDCIVVRLHNLITQVV